MNKAPTNFAVAEHRSLGPLDKQIRIGRRAVTVSELSFYLFIAGAIAGLFQLFHRIEFSIGYEMVTIASNLAQHGGFANPFDLTNTGPTAVEPPVYPLYLALITKLWKQPGLVAFVASMSNLFSNAFIAALLPRVSLLFYGDLIPGLAGGILWVGAAQLMPSWDASYTIAGLLLFCLFSAASIRRSDKPVVFGGWTGLVCGLLFLLNTSSILVSLPWIGYLLICRRTRLKQAIAYCCALFAILCLIASVWILRNARELGAPVLRTNLGMTLYASNNDCAKPSLIETERQGCYETHHPNEGMNEARLLKHLGEVEYDRKRTADAAEWVHGHPQRFLYLTLRRARNFWFPPPEKQQFPTYVIWLITALSVPGLILMAWNRQAVILFAGSSLLIYPLMYYVVVSDARYQYPVLWISALSAGYSILSLARLAKFRLSRAMF